MRKTLSLLLRIVGINQDIPKTWQGRCLCRLNRAATVVAILYVALQAFPQMLFAHSATADDITFYSRRPLAADLIACAARARRLVQRSELAVPGRSEKVFLCDSPWLFTLFSPISANAFAFSVPITDNVFVAAADASGDMARSRAPVYNTRVFSSVVAHDITHGLIRHRLGWLRGNLLPTWIAEGYCDYVAGEGSFPEATGRYLLASGRSDPSPSFRYFEYRQMMRYLIDERHLSFAQVIERANDSVAVEAETRESVREHAQP